MVMPVKEQIIIKYVVSVIKMLFLRKSKHKYLISSLLFICVLVYPSIP